ncbi:MAG: hypothetical protein ABMA13_23010 [Chthoniobacteraceae bacterium]
MKIEFADELVIEGVARAVERALMSPAMIERVAESISQRFELITPAEAAGLLDKTTRWLRENDRGIGLDKSVAFGATNPMYFLSQVLELARAKVVRGRQGEKNVVQMKGRAA